MAPAIAPAFVAQACQAQGARRDGPSLNAICVLISGKQSQATELLVREDDVVDSV